MKKETVGEFYFTHNRGSLNKSSRNQPVDHNKATG